MITAKDAKERFFLTPKDLQRLSFERPSGWGAYVSGNGACKLYSTCQVQRLALSIWGYAGLVQKAEAKEKRLDKKHAKAISDAKERERIRQEQIAAEAKRKEEALVAKKAAAAERKRKSEEQIKFADNWRTVLRHFEGEGEGTDVNAVMLTDLTQVLTDAEKWRAHINNKDSCDEGEQQSQKRVKVES